MMPNSHITVQSLACTDVQTLRNCFNASFRQYYVPLQFTKEQFAEKITTEAIDLKLSFGIFDEDLLVGFILHGIDSVGNQKVAYNAGTGILPDYRGHKLSYLLYEYSIGQLKKAGVTKTILEVVEQNMPAIKSYVRMGFSVTRKLNSYQGRPILNEVPSIEIETLPAPDWALIKRSCEWNPSWQYNTNCIKRAQSNYKLQVARCDQQPVAYCISNLETGRIAHFGCCDIEYKEKYLSALFNEVNGVNGDHLTSVINVDTNALYANTFLLSIGLRRLFTACEMEMAL
ncbi:MAG: GNAT family N-acetyltransferase [Bacteroidota bacterium]|nr:GNAT family N-acetyltransferase [Ferruginibacter sp.]